MKNEKQTVGEHFQEVRKEKNISIDEIVRDTNIPKRYLESIEADNFDVFPGETYAMGFITNYADALEVDRETALNLYRRQMKIEQDSPIEQLVGKKKEFSLSNNMIIGIAIALGSLLIIVLVLFIMTQTKDNSTGSAPLPPRTFTFTFDNISKVPAQHFRVGDSVNITNATKAILVTFVSTSPSRALTLRINQNEYTIKTGELFTIDSDSNGTNDLGIEVFSAKEKDIRIAVSPLRDTSNSLLSAQDDLYNRYKEFILSESVMMQTNAKGPAMVKLTASGTGWVHYIIDDRDEKESVMNSGETMVIPFNDNMTLYLGNGGAFKVGVSGKEEDGGGWGEVGKSIFYWKNKDNKFQLVRAVLK